MPNSPEIGQHFHRRVTKWLEDRKFTWVYRMKTGHYLEGEPTTPFDIWAMKEGVSYCIECKSCKDCLLVSTIKPHQLEGLLSASQAGAYSFLAVEVRAVNRVYLLSIGELTKMIDLENKSIITVDDLEQRGKRIE